jgi:hypothetical protein
LASGRLNDGDHDVWEDGAMKGLICMLLALGLLLPAARASDEFRPAEYVDILREHQLVGLSRPGRGTYTYFPPAFRYRLKLATTGRLVEIDEGDRKYLKNWGDAHHAIKGDDFVANFTHKAEVMIDGRACWIYWQTALIEPFRKELANGGKMNVNVLLLGAIGDQPVLMAISYGLAES